MTYQPTDHECSPTSSLMLNFIDFYHWIGGAMMIFCKEAWSGRGPGLVHSFIKMVSFLNFADVWIRTVDRWCWKWTLNQLSHNHCRTKWFLFSQVQGGRMEPPMTICAPALPNIVEKISYPWHLKRNSGVSVRSGWNEKKDFVVYKRISGDSLNLTWTTATKSAR